jgi:hypothetical protein
VAADANVISLPMGVSVSFMMVAPGWFHSAHARQSRNLRELMLKPPPEAIDWTTG